MKEGVSRLKYFIITVDTEGDNLWGKKSTDKVTTVNATKIPIFQELCEKFCFKPVYLVNYEMTEDAFFIDYISPKIEKGLCEIGMHLHAWNMPGSHPLEARKDITPGLPYLIEYPIEVMEEKISIMTNQITNRFGVKPKTHRAGRWAMDERYFELLKKYGYTVDCSVTPHVSWKSSPGYTKDSCGSDYRNAPESPYFVHGDAEENMILEIPMTIRERVKYNATPERWNIKGIKRAIRCRMIGNLTWLRILDESVDGQLRIIQQDNSEYLMFMLHSSELIAGNNFFQTENQVRKFYENMETVFRTASQSRAGITLKEYKKVLVNKEGTIHVTDNNK
jgi:hypothetical protein